MGDGQENEGTKSNNGIMMNKGNMKNELCCLPPYRGCYTARI